jgi:hypothetical protein
MRGLDPEIPSKTFWGDRRDWHGPLGGGVWGLGSNPIHHRQQESRDENADFCDLHLQGSLEGFVMTSTSLFKVFFWTTFIAIIICIVDRHCRSIVDPAAYLLSWY